MEHIIAVESHIAYGLNFVGYGYFVYVCAVGKSTVTYGVKI